MFRLLVIAVLAWALLARADAPVVADLPPSINADGVEDITAQPHHTIQSCRPVGSSGGQWICSFEYGLSGHKYVGLCNTVSCGLLQ